MGARRILIVEDDPRAGAALVRQLGLQGFRTALVRTIDDALERIDNSPFDAVLLDLPISGADVLADLQLVKARAPGAKAIVLTESATVDVAVACMKRGAHDVIVKPPRMGALLELIKASLLEAKAPLSADPSDIGTATLWKRVGLARAQWGLSKRQAEVLATLARGSSNKDISLELRCSESTVELHVTALLRKSGASSRTELVARFWTLAP